MKARPGKLYRNCMNQYRYRACAQYSLSLHVVVLFIGLNHCHICSRLHRLEGLFKMLPDHTLSLDVLMHGTQGGLLAERNNLMQERDKATNTHIGPHSNPNQLTHKLNIDTVNNCRALPHFRDVIMGLVYTLCSPQIGKITGFF